MTMGMGVVPFALLRTASYVRDLNAVFQFVKPTVETDRSWLAKSVMMGILGSSMGVLDVKLTAVTIAPLAFVIQYAEMVWLLGLKNAMTTTPFPGTVAALLDPSKTAGRARRLYARHLNVRKANAAMASPVESKLVCKISVMMEISILAMDALTIARWNAATSALVVRQRRRMSAILNAEMATGRDLRSVTTETALMGTVVIVLVRSRPDGSAALVLLAPSQSVRPAFVETVLSLDLRLGKKGERIYLFKKICNLFVSRARL